VPRTSKETAGNVTDLGVLEERTEELGDYTVGFTTFRDGGDATPVFRGLPDDRCQSEHWGYVFSGKLTFRYADHDEVYEAGDAYYAPPGHIPVVEAGTEVVEFSPTAKYRQTMEVVASNMAALMAG
jgi:mannose-6-phosphate isomerase-like protein (cupin superfamily)